MPKIGEGGFGVVYKYKTHQGPELAIKQEIKVLPNVWMNILC